MAGVEGVKPRPFIELHYFTMVVKSGEEWN
jgi:hypothetical protein